MSSLLKKCSSCFESLSTNGKYPIPLIPSPFALRLSKGEGRVLTTYVSAIAAALFLLTAQAGPAAAQLKKIRFAVATIAISEVPFKVAQLKGFYREEGLDVEMILIRGAVGAPALISGSVDYTSSSGAVIAAGVRGLKMKLILIVASKPAFDLVASAQIQSIPQLKGKIVGLSSRGGAVDLLTQAVLKRNGLNPNTDVTTMVVGSQEELMIALRTGRISAALLSSPRQFMLYREGFKQLGYAGDYMPTYPTGGIGATDDKIMREPGEVSAFVRASLKGMKYYKQNPVEATNILVGFLGIKDSPLAAQVYSAHVERLAPNGYEDDSWANGAIEFTKQSLGIKKEIPVSQVFDFSFVKKSL
jgi:NitT/TauT family transport system substrate-binding protein